MKNEVLEAMLVLSDGHYTRGLAEMSIGMIVPSVMYCENGTKYEGDFHEYLEKMNVDYYTARNMIEEHVGKLDSDITCGDAYYALAMVYADYGLAIHGNKELALKLAYGWLNDPDR